MRAADPQMDRGWGAPPDARHPAPAHIDVDRSRQEYAGDARGCNPAPRRGTRLRSPYRFPLTPRQWPQGFQPWRYPETRKCSQSPHRHRHSRPRSRSLRRAIESGCVRCQPVLWGSPKTPCQGSAGQVGGQRQRLVSARGRGGDLADCWSLASYKPECGAWEWRI